MRDVKVPFSRTTAAIAVLGTIMLAASVARARDLGFRYRDGRCVNEQGGVGLNPAFLGPCGDLRNTILARLDLSDMDLSGSRFEGADVQENSFRHANLIGTNFHAANLSGVDLTAAIMREADFSNATMKNAALAGADIRHVNFSGVDFSGGQLSYVNLSSCRLAAANFSRAALDHADFSGAVAVGGIFSGATLTGARFDGADVSTADFGLADLSAASFKSVVARRAQFRSAVARGASFEGAALDGANFRGAKMDAVVLKSAKLNNADVRSSILKDATINGAEWHQAVFNQHTVLPFTNDVAQSLGMTFQKGGSLLILWDQKSDEVTALTKRLQDDGADVALTAAYNGDFTGDSKLADYSAILHLNGATPSTEMPEAGQDALVAYVKNGGTYIGTEWNSYSLLYGRLQNMRDLILLDRDGGNTATLKFVPVAEQKNHPLLDGFTEVPTVKTGFSTGHAHAFSTQPSVVVMKDEAGDDVVIARNFGAGRIVSIDVAPNYNGNGVLANVGIQRLIENAVNW